MKKADTESRGTKPASGVSGFAVSNRYRYYILGLLVAVGVCSWVDRNVFSVLLESIKLEFSFSDTQLGLLGGVAFGLFYASVGLPIAYLADRFNRRNIITIALFLWSLMTALSGAAVGFVSLFLARIGVGVGEAGGAPPSQSLVSDYFPPEKRGFAMGILYLYIPLGFLVGFLLGGWINEFFGWRKAFFVVGVPGIILSILLRLTLREPPRGHADGKQDPGVTPSLPSTIRYFLSRPSMRHIPLAGVRRAYCDKFRERFTGGKNGPVFGFLLDHPMMQDVVDVAPDRQTAAARFRCLMMAGTHYEKDPKPSNVARQWWEGALYENTYVRLDGVWKIKILNYRPVWHATFEDGWAYTPPEFVPMAVTTYPDDPLGPDEIADYTPRLWPDHEVMTFHCEHPVTGKPIVTPEPGIKTGKKQL